MIKPLCLFIDGVLIQSYPKKGGIQGSLFFANLNAKKTCSSLESNRVLFDSLQTYCLAF
jgi:hypothetical protein